MEGEKLLREHKSISLGLCVPGVSGAVRGRKAGGWVGRRAREELGSYRLTVLSVQVQPSVRRIHVRAGEGVREAREAPIDAPPITAGRLSTISWWSRGKSMRGGKSQTALFII